MTCICILSSSHTHHSYQATYPARPGHAYTHGSHGLDPRVSRFVVPAVKACPSLRVSQDHIDRKCSRWYPTVCTLSVKDLVRTRQGTSGHRTLRQLYCSPRKMDPTIARKQYRGAQGPCCRGVVRIQRQYGQLSTQYVSPYPHGIGRR